MPYFCRSWNEVLGVYQRSLQYPEAEFTAIVQDVCGVETAFFYEVRALLAAREPRVVVH